MKKELPKDRLATTDASGKRVYLHPIDYKGYFKNRRTLAQGILILIFLGLPWLRINGSQALLFDISKRRFAVFGVTFWAHEAPLLFFYFAGFAITIAFITTIFGRAWCGWACPQTVFVDAIFRKIERWIEGDHLSRQALEDSNWDFDKIFKRSAKWFFFTAVSLIIAHSFLAYFVGTDEIFKMVRTPPSENLPSFLVMMGAAAIVLFDFGWFKEQFCTIMCPYGRLQSVMMDNRSLAVLYDKNRTDCVNCYKCVQVCPTGIDIRRGLQLECVACTSCIDVCNDVMTRLHRPKGLIRYSTRDEIEEGRKSKLLTQFVRPRSLILIFLLTVIVGGLTYNLRNRSMLDVTVFRAHEAPYQVLLEKIILNHFVLEIENKSMKNSEVSVAIDDADKNAGFEVVTSQKSIQVHEGRSARYDIFIKFPKAALKAGHATLNLQIKSEITETKNEVLKLVGPDR